MLVEESIQSAISSIRSNGIRSILTALAIIIGTAAVIAVIGIGKNAFKVRENRPFCPYRKAKSSKKCYLW